MSALRQPAQGDFFPDIGQLRLSVEALTQHYIWFYPRLIPVAGGHKGALLLANMLHWSRHLHIKAPERDGWLWKTHEEWKKETGLSRHEFEAAKRELMEGRVLQSIKRGMPAKTFYRLNLGGLSLALGKVLKVPVDKPLKWDWTNSAAMLQLLGRPTAFYTHLATLMDSATDALHLSFLIQSQRSFMTAALTPEWISPRTEHIRERLGLSYKQQLASRKRLGHAGLIDQRMSHAMTPKPEVRIRFGRVTEGLLNKARNVPKNNKFGKGVETSNTNSIVHAANQSGGTTTTQSNDLATAQSVGSANTQLKDHAAVQGVGPSNTSSKLGEESSLTKEYQGKPVDFQPIEQLFPFSANSNLPFQQTAISISGKQQFPFSADMIAEKGSPYIYKIQTKQQPHKSSLFSKQDGQPDPSQCGGGDCLIDLTGVQEQWHASARNALMASGLSAALQQEVADEWNGRFTDNRQSPLMYPLRYLDKLIRLAQDGTFVQELGVSVAQSRQSRIRAQRQADRIWAGSDSKTSKESGAAFPFSANKPTSTPASSEQVKQEGLARLKELRQQIKAGALADAKSGGLSTTQLKDHAAVQSGVSDTTQSKDHAAVQSGVSDTTQSKDHAAAQSGVSDTTQSKDHAAAQSGVSDTTQSKDHAAAQSGGSSTLMAKLFARSLNPSKDQKP